MTIHTIRHLSFAIALVLGGCSYEIPQMTPEQSNNIERLTARMTSRCIGRYVVDLPEAFVLNSQARTEIEGVKIKTVRMHKDPFESALALRETELAKQRMLLKREVPFLRNVTPLDGESRGAIFNRAESTGTAGIKRVLELWGWKTGYQVLLEINATDYPGAGFDDPDDPPDDTRQKLKHLLRVYDRLSGRNEHEIPTEQGVCFPNGFLRGAPTNSEWIDLNYHLSSAEDVYFRFISLSDIGPQESRLLERGKEINAMLDEVNGRTLRKGTRNENGQEFEEWLMMRESDPGVKDYHLILEMNSQEGNASRPFATLTMSSGIRKPGPTPTLEQAATRKPIEKATLGEAESVALWDRVTATFRPRPGAF